MEKRLQGPKMAGGKYKKKRIFWWNGERGRVEGSST